MFAKSTKTNTPAINLCYKIIYLKKDIKRMKQVKDKSNAQNYVLAFRILKVKQVNEITAEGHTLEYQAIDFGPKTTQKQ